jgi:hypothetical protein
MRNRLYYNHPPGDLRDLRAGIVKKVFKKREPGAVSIWLKGKVDEIKDRNRR